MSAQQPSETGAASAEEISDAQIQELRQKIDAVMASSQQEVEEQEPQQSWWAKYGIWVALALIGLKWLHRLATG